MVSRSRAIDACASSRRASFAIDGDIIVAPIDQKPSIDGAAKS